MQTKLAIIFLILFLLSGLYLPVSSGEMWGISVAEASGTQSISNLPVGSRVVDPSWEWEYRTGENYSGTGETKPIVWIVVAKNHYGSGSGVTLLSEEVVGKYVFDNSTNITTFGFNHWGESGGHSTATSGLRPWLNQHFYSAFSNSFKSSLNSVTIPNRVGRTGDHYYTQDRVFIPTITELGDTRITEPPAYSHETYIIGTAYTYFVGAKNSDRIASLGDANSWYWTRSPDRLWGSGNRDLRCINNYGSDGYGPVWANANWDGGGVRPALNVKSNTLVSAIPNEDGVYLIGSEVTQPVKSPVITSVSPASPEVKMTKQPFTIYGDNFEPGLKVILTAPGGTPYTIPRSDNPYIDVTPPGRIDLNAGLLTAGTWQVKVINPDGQESNSYSFEVRPKAIDADIVSWSAGPRDIKVGDQVTLTMKFTNTGSQGHQFIAGASLWDPGGVKIDFSPNTNPSSNQNPIYLSPGQSHTVTWTYTINKPGGWGVQFAVWEMYPLGVTENLIVKEPYPMASNYIYAAQAETSAWTRLTSASARAIAFESPILAASFEGYGVGHYNGTWSSLTPATAIVLATDGNLLAASFEGFGVWFYDGVYDYTWLKLNSVTAQALTLYDGLLVASFEGFGIWFYDGSFWQKLSSASATALVLDNHHLVASIEGFGVWVFDGTWSKLTSATAQAIASNNGVVVASFSDHGTWRYDGEWARISPAAARALDIDGGVVAASFDGLGVWLYTGDGTWSNITSATADILALEGRTLIASFEGQGVWLYE